MKMRIECIIDGVNYSEAVTEIAKARIEGMSESEIRSKLAHIPHPDFRITSDGIAICYPIRPKTLSRFDQETCILAHAHPHSKPYAGAIKSLLGFSKISKARRFITGRWTHYMRCKAPWIQILAERGKTIDPTGIVSDSDRR